MANRLAKELMNVLGITYKNLPHDERVRFDEYMKIGDDALRDFLATHYGIVEGERIG